MNRNMDRTRTGGRGSRGRTGSKDAGQARSTIGKGGGYALERGVGKNGGANTGATELREAGGLRAKGKMRGRMVSISNILLD